MNILNRQLRETKLSENKKINVDYESKKLIRIKSEIKNYAHKKQIDAV